MTPFYKLISKYTDNQTPDTHSPSFSQNTVHVKDAL